LEKTKKKILKMLLKVGQKYKFVFFFSKRSTLQQNFQNENWDE